MELQSHAARQGALYREIWEQDPGYGTRQEDVDDTVEHRIIPHMRRVDAMPANPVIHYGPGCGLVIDFGAGDGRFLKALHRFGACRIGIGVDVAGPETLAHWMGWRRQVLWEPIPERGDYVISTDTLEHMPPEAVPAVMKNIARTAEHGFLRISTKQDIYGTERGLHLHETVEPPEWWLAACRTAGIEPTSWRVYPGHAVEIWW